MGIDVPCKNGTPHSLIRISEYSHRMNGSVAQTKHSAQGTVDKLPEVATSGSQLPQLCRHYVQVSLLKSLSVYPCQYL